MLYPIAPPTVLTERESAAAVVMRASGATRRATLAVGTIIPPRPKQAIVARATVVLGFSGVIAAKAPPKAVMMTAAERRTSRLFFGKVDSAALKAMAPRVVEIAGGRPLRPTWIGSLG